MKSWGSHREAKIGRHRSPLGSLHVETPHFRLPVGRTDTPPPQDLTWRMFVIACGLTSPWKLRRAFSTMHTIHGDMDINRQGLRDRLSLENSRLDNPVTLVKILRTGFRV